MKTLEHILESDVPVKFLHENALWEWARTFLQEYRAIQARGDEDVTFWKQDNETFQEWLRRLPIHPQPITEEVRKKEKERQFFFFLFSARGQDVLEIALQLGSLRRTQENMKDHPQKEFKDLDPQIELLVERIAIMTQEGAPDV